MYNLDNIKLKKIIESLIFSSPTPVSTKELMKFFSDEEVSLKLVQELIAELQNQYSNLGVNFEKSFYWLQISSFRRLQRMGYKFLS